MFLIKSPLDNENTTVRLHHYDNRHKHEWTPQQNNGLQWGHSVRLLISFPLKEG